jgi:hypothetical protein
MLHLPIHGFSDESNNHPQYHLNYAQIRALSGVEPED